MQELFSRTKEVGIATRPHGCWGGEGGKGICVTIAWARDLTVGPLAADARLLKGRGLCIEHIDRVPDASKRLPAVRCLASTPPNRTPLGHQSLNKTSMAFADGNDLEEMDVGDDRTFNSRE